MQGLPSDVTIYHILSTLPDSSQRKTSTMEGSAIGRASHNCSTLGARGMQVLPKVLANYETHSGADCTAQKNKRANSKEVVHFLRLMLKVICHDSRVRCTGQGRDVPSSAVTRRDCPSAHTDTEDPIASTLLWTTGFRNSREPSETVPEGGAQYRTFSSIIDGLVSAPRILFAA